MKPQRPPRLMQRKRKGLILKFPYIGRLCDSFAYFAVKALLRPPFGYEDQLRCDISFLRNPQKSFLTISSEIPDAQTSIYIIFEMQSSAVIKRFTLPYILFLFAILTNGCSKTEVKGTVEAYIPERLNRVTENSNASCTSDNNPFFSCYLDESLPFYQAETVKERVEVSFGAVENKAAIINPAYRGLFDYLAMQDALFTNFMMTGISEADFDSIQTDYLFRDLTPADYYLNLTPHMNCIFFRSANSNYGLIRINSTMGTGATWSPVKVSFDMKYVNLAQ